MLDNCWERLPVRLFSHIPHACDITSLYTRKGRLWVVVVAYELLHLIVVLFGGRETPLVLQAEIGGSVKEGIHLRHSVQTGKGLEKETCVAIIINCDTNTNGGKEVRNAAFKEEDGGKA